MAFDQTEQNIINYGLKNGKTKDDVKRAITNYRLGITTTNKSPSTPISSPEQPGFTSNVGDNFSKASNNAAIAATESIKNRGKDIIDKTKGFVKDPTVGNLARTGLNIAGDTGGIAADAINNQFGGAIKGASDTVSDMKPVQDFASSKPVSGALDVVNSGINTIKSEIDKVKAKHPQATRAIEDVMNVVNGYLSVEGLTSAIKDDVSLTKNIINGSEPTITVGGKTLTHAQVNSSEGVDFFKTLSPADQQAMTNFDHLYTAKQMLENATKAGKDTSDLQLLYDQAKKGMVIPIDSSATIAHSAELIPPVVKSTTQTIGDESGITKTAGNIASDVVPTVDRIVNSEVTKALDLTQGDVKNISLSTGNDVGRFLADNNLIGGNVKETTANINKFYKDNYAAVRNEINAVKTTYNPAEIPRYKEALQAIQKQITETPGLQSENYEVEKLLKKPNPTLVDVQRVKELMDDHFNLYKATGDVKEGVAKEGLVNIRQDLKEWIEGEVKDRSGVDIRKLNNNVQTARSIEDAIETRSTRGLTRATISAGDIITFLSGSGAAGPLGGAIAVIAKKIYQSPSFKLKLSQFLDGLSDARRVNILDDLQKGKIPTEVKQL